MTSKKNLVELVENVAKAGGEPIIPREFIIMAYDMIDNKEVEVRRYPMGAPLLTDVYNIAKILHQEADKLVEEAIKLVNKH